MQRNVSPTILVVDDEPSIADLYAYRLSSTYDVRTAYSGEEALEMVDDDVDVVLLDRRMPDISGDDVLREFRKRGHDVRVAMVTAVDPDFDVLDLGFDAYVVKPAPSETIFEVVESLLDLATYDDEVQILFSMATRLAAIESEKSPAELAESEEYQALVGESAAMERTASSRIRSFDDEEFLAAFHSLSRPSAP